MSYKGIPESQKERTVVGVSNKVKVGWGKRRYSNAYQAGSSTLTGTSTLVSVSDVNSNSCIVVTPANQPSGTKWWVVAGDGFFVVHSNSDESSEGTEFNYFVSNARR